MILNRLIVDKRSTAANMRIGYMAGWTFSHWAEVMLSGCGSGRSNTNGLFIIKLNNISLPSIGSRADTAMNPSTSPMHLR